MDFKDISPELQEWACACETVEEMVALAREEGVELSAEQLAAELAAKPTGLPATGFVTIEGREGLYLVQNGTIDESAQSLVQDPNNPDTWYWVEDGRVRTDYTGFMGYAGGTFYIESGVRSHLNGFVEHEGALFYLADGQLQDQASGMIPASVDGPIYFVSLGKVQDQIQGDLVLVNLDGTDTWCYVDGGVWDQSFEGPVQHDGHWFYVQNGVFAKKFNGWVNVDGERLRFRNGEVR